MQNFNFQSENRNLIESKLALKRFLINKDSNDDDGRDTDNSGKTMGKYNLQHGSGKYDGELLNGEPHGYGVAIYPGGMRYEGNWRNCLRHGYGVEVFTNGNFFEGVFAFGSRSGYGTFYFSDGSCETGEWTGNKLNGYATRKNFSQNAWSEGIFDNS